jgi:hypothetical protein
MAVITMLPIIKTVILFTEIFGRLDLIIFRNELSGRVILPKI